MEADSTFYRLPDESLVSGWEQRIPEGFTTHVKAFAMMTRHPVKLEVLPEDLRNEVEVDGRGRVSRPSRAVRAEVFRRVLKALEPLRETGTSVALAPYITAKPSSYEYSEWAGEQLHGH